MSDAATPAVPENGGIPPAAPAATPASGDNNPAAQPEKVTLTKEEHDQLLRDQARASANQRKADLYDRLYGGKGNAHFKQSKPATPPSDEEAAATAAAEDRKAERGLMALALDPQFRPVFDNDPTLRDLITKNPLAILPVLAPEALDADDAISLVKEALSKRKPSAPTPPANPPATPPETPPTPPTGGVNPPGKDMDDDYEAARKNPNLENAIAGMVKIKGKRISGK